LRILVTGGAGYVGSHICKALEAAGHTPVVFDNLRTGHRWAVKWGPLEIGDISDTSAVQAAIQRHEIEAVMHFAALAYVGESVAHPEIYYRANVAGTISLLDAMRAEGVERLVFSSTCATYGDVETLPIVETTPQIPVNPYGRSKLMVEHVLRDFAVAHPLGAVALRYFNAAGADVEGDIGEEHHPEPHLIPLVLQTALGERAAIDIFGDDYDTPDGACIRDYIHVSDLATAHVAALDRCETRGFSAFNLGTGQGVSVKEMIEVARKVTGRPIASRIASRRPGDPSALVADASLARRSLGWTPRHSAPEILVETAWRWMTQHRAKVGLPIPAETRPA